MAKLTTAALAAAIISGVALASGGAMALPSPELAVAAPTSNPTWVKMSKKKMMMMKRKKMMMKKKKMM